MNPNLYNNSIVDGYLENSLSIINQSDSNEFWKEVSYDGSTGFSQVGDAPCLWIVTSDFLYMKDNTIDMGLNATNS